MPQVVSEITQGHSQSRKKGGGEFQDSGTATRVFRVVLSYPGETFDPVSTCGVSPGSSHPNDSTLVCTDYSSSFEGESRFVMLVTFNYSGEGNQDNGLPPDMRPANWTLGSALMERPCRVWRRLNRLINIWGPWQFPVNPAGDIYDGIVTVDPIVTITITQYCVSDPTVSAMHVGKINSEEIQLGSLIMDPHTVMLRSIQSQATVETFRDVTYRGWTATWEFAYRENIAYIHLPGEGGDAVPQKGDSGEEVAIGWDMAVPVTGVNVIAIKPDFLVDANNRNTGAIDVYGQPLKHGEEGTPFYGKIAEPLALENGVAEGSRQRAMVRVFSYEGGGASQAPSALPVPLDPAGHPRNTEPFADGSRYYPIVWRYQVYQEMNFTQTLGLRLF